jgi:membrane-bound metal-dependent hydrolase YbcI (DUF457 family)
MDNVTHSLFALTIARTRLCRAGRGTTVALVLSSNAPDIDILATTRGALNYLEWHRGPTHGPLGVLGLGVLTAGLVWMGLRATRGGGDHEASFGRLAGVSILGVFLHVMMDVPTAYGTRLLSPFDWHWFAVDWMPILDIYLLAALGAGLYFGGRSDAARGRNVAIVLTLMVANYGIRGVAHHHAVVLAPRLFGPTLPERCAGSASARALIDRWPDDTSTTVPGPGRPRCLLEVAAIPSFSSPFEWRVIARMSDAYQTQDLNVLSPRMLAAASEREALWRLSLRYPDQWTPAALSAATTRTGQVFLGFSRFPVTRSFRDAEDVTVVQWSDVRFVGNGPLRPSMASGRGRGQSAGPPISRSLFSATVRLDAQGRVLDERLGP